MNDWYGIRLLKSRDDFTNDEWTAFIEAVLEPLAAKLNGDLTSARGRLALTGGWLITYPDWERQDHAELAVRLRQAAVSQLSVDDPATVVRSERVSG